MIYGRCPNKHENSVTNLISTYYELALQYLISKKQNVNMSARVYFMRTVNGCEDVSIMSPPDGQVYFV